MCKCMFMRVSVCLSVCVCACVPVCVHVHVQMCPLLPIICKCWGRGLTLSLLCVPCCSSGRGINTRQAECLRLAEDWHTLAKGGAGAHPAPLCCAVNLNNGPQMGCHPLPVTWLFCSCWHIRTPKDCFSQPDAKLCMFPLPALLCEKLIRIFFIPATFYKMACKPSRFACLMTDVLNSQDKYVTTPQEQLCPALPPLVWGAGSVLVCTTRLLPRGSFSRGHLAIFQKYLVATAHERGVTGIRAAEAKTITPQWPLGTEHHPGQ